MSYRLDRLSVLVVDDNRYMLSLLSEILRGFGIRELVVLTDAATAFQEIKSTAADVVITDHVMSPISGIEFVTMLRTSDDSPDRFVPVIMVSGYSDLGTVRQARDAGVTEFLAKPISARGLYMRLLEVIDNARPFIQSKTFFGPDRRRRQEIYKGEDRRSLTPEEGSTDEVKAYPAISPAV